MIRFAEVQAVRGAWKIADPDGEAAHEIETDEDDVRRRQPRELETAGDSRTGHPDPFRAEE